MRIKGIYNYTELFQQLEKLTAHIESCKAIEYKVDITVNGNDEEYKELEDDAELTLTEAAKELGLSDGSVLRAAIKKGIFKEGEYRIVGKTYLLLESAVERYREEYKRNMN